MEMQTHIHTARTGDKRKMLLVKHKRVRVGVRLINYLLKLSVCIISPLSAWCTLGRSQRDFPASPPVHSG